MRWIRRVIVACLMILPTVFAIYWTTIPALLAVVAISRFPIPNPQESEWEDKRRVLEVKRRIQKHFLDYSVYLPMEDIIVPVSLGDERTELSFLMQNTCGRATLYVWIPFKFRLPLIGDKVIDWCWKPFPKSA